VTLKAAAVSDDDTSLVTDVQTYDGVINFGTVKTKSGESLLVDSSGMSAFTYSEERTNDDDSAGNKLLTESGSIIAEVRLFEGCSSAVNCNSPPVLASSATKVALKATTIELQNNSLRVYEKEMLFRLTFASESYARWFFPDLKASV
jgi:hypothetical protein